MKRLNKTIIWGLAGAMAFANTSCESFDKVNTDPNTVTPEKVAAINLLSFVMLPSTLNVDQWQRQQNLYADTFAQYFSNDKYESNVCEPNDKWNEEFWLQHWTWIANLNEVVRRCDGKEDMTNLKSIARIWKAWCFLRATDLFGDLPYFKACDGSGIPAGYDAQKDIYYDLVKELTEASSEISSNGGKVGIGDLIFQGDMAKWKAFANSLRLRIALRMTEVDPEKAKAEAEAAVAADGGLITDNVVIWRAENYYQNTINPHYFYAHYWESRLTMSVSMQRVLTNLGGVPVEMKSYYKSGQVPEYADPRALIMYNVTSTGTLASRRYRGRWKGVEAGYTPAIAAEDDNAHKNNSRVGVFFVSLNPEPPENTPPVICKDRWARLMYASEVYFLRAEGALRGWNMGGTAESFYEAGIRRSMAEYGNLIKSADIEAYLQSTMKNGYGTSVKFSDNTGDVTDDCNSKLAKIITQKYISNFPDGGFEAWADYRRLGMPALDPFKMPTENFVIEVGGHDYLGSCRRITYPSYEQLHNEANYKKCLEDFGPDVSTKRMWWDSKRTKVVKWEHYRPAQGEPGYEIGTLKDAK